jgi:hypothetical protein
MAMNFVEADMTPEYELNEIIWKSVRGADSRCLHRCAQASSGSSTMTMTKRRRAPAGPSEPNSRAENPGERLFVRRLTAV